MSKVALTAAKIIDLLHGFYPVDRVRYKMNNAYIFKSDWESDFFLQLRSGYSYEFEVKVSRSDFLVDRKKVDKHLIMTTGKYNRNMGRKHDLNPVTGRWEYGPPIMKETEHSLRPNRFYYVMPAGLVATNEIPQHAGLFTVSPEGYFTKAKEAPILHRETLSFEKVLCSKYFFHWNQGKTNNIFLQMKLEKLLNQFNNLVANSQIDDFSNIGQF